MLPLEKYSQLKAAGAVTVTVESGKYYLNYTRYHQWTGEAVEVLKQEVTVADVQAVRAEINARLSDVTADRASLDELIADAQAL